MDILSCWYQTTLRCSRMKCSRIFAKKEEFSKNLVRKIIIQPNMFSCFLHENHIKHVLTPAYHPSSKGQVERYVQRVKSGLRKALFGKQQSGLHSALQNFLLHYRKVPHSATGSSPARDVRTAIFDQKWTYSSVKNSNPQPLAQFNLRIGLLFAKAMKTCGNQAQ